MSADGPEPTSQNAVAMSAPSSEADPTQMFHILTLCESAAVYFLRPQVVIAFRAKLRISDHRVLTAEEATMASAAITDVQAFAMEMLFRVRNENPVNRTWEEYQQICAKIPSNLKVVTGMINDELRTYSQTDEFKSRKFCRFRAGDEIIRYETYPNSISIETVRQALIAYGWREPRKRAA